MLVLQGPWLCVCAAGAAGAVQVQSCRVGASVQATDWTWGLTSVLSDCWGPDSQVCSWLAVWISSGLRHTWRPATGAGPVVCRCMGGGAGPRCVHGRRGRWQRPGPESLAHAVSEAGACFEEVPRVPGRDGRERGVSGEGLRWPLSASMNTCGASAGETCRGPQQLCQLSLLQGLGLLGSSVGRSLGAVTTVTIPSARPWRTSGLFFLVSNLMIQVCCSVWWKQDFCHQLQKAEIAAWSPTLAFWVKVTLT